MSPDAVTMEKIVALTKRRGFIFPTGEIYGGLGSTYDFAHYGVLLKTNVKNAWWQTMLQERDDVVALDSAILQHPKTWEPPATWPASPIRWSSAWASASAVSAWTTCRRRRSRRARIPRTCAARCAAASCPSRATST